MGSAVPRTLLLLMLASCSPDTTFVARDDGNRPGLSAPDDDDGAEPADDTAAPDDTAGPEDTAAVDTGDTGTADTGDTDPVEDTERPPGPGDLVITELMIDPSAVPDGQGEWVELKVTASGAVDLAGLELGDDNVDSYVIEPVAGTTFVVDPGDIVVLCAESATADNGGVDCDGTYLYLGFGGGFALANAGDEVVLRDAGGIEIDRVEYDDSIVSVGASAGLSPARTTSSANDDLGNWCTQRSEMSGGDRGTPGRTNDAC